MITRIKFWLECSRWYALPMSFFSWLVIFTYSVTKDGNILYGILALVGICFAHLATNLFDDYIDFHNLQKIIDENNLITLPNTQKGKCRYLLNNSVKLEDVLKIVTGYCSIACLIGLFLVFSVGKGILLFMGLGATIVLLYSFLSNKRLSELAVALAYGPLLFCGTYYAMCGSFSIEPLILCLPTMFFTVNLLYTDNFLDRDLDIDEGKQTIQSLFPNPYQSLNIQKKLLIIGYLSVLLICICDITDWQVALIYLTIPFSFDLINSLKQYIEDKTSIPERKWFHFPFEDWKDIETNRSASFMFRMYQARNLMIYVSCLLTIGLLW